MKKTIMLFASILTPIKAENELSNQDLPQSLLDYSGEYMPFSKW